ncbi:regulatory protein [Fodinibius salinus]|uniref:Regulatory protein RecX n=1 Tax=Fodinibius salinus TaxID=860790 RepID=A0A5D3YHD8_9BACT|nr:regulatory protein RecX [Fodinibius salinus]TYP92609.1 regulatory protein [Fodinibius salinus]
MDEISNHNLPGVISAVSVQKNDKERYSIFVDDEFLIGIAEHTLLKFNLAKGDTITPSLFRKLQRQEGRSVVKSYMMKLLGRRDHARKELFTKAIRKDYEKDVIEDVLNELQQKGYLNEAKFADKFASDKSRLNKWGPQKIKSHLFKKGIPNKIAEQSIQKTFEDVDLKQRFLDLVLKRKRRFLREEDVYKRKKKVVDHLARKGYRPGNIFDHIDELMEAIAQ